MTGIGIVSRFWLVRSTLVVLFGLAGGMVPFSRQGAAWAIDPPAAVSIPLQPDPEPLNLNLLKPGVIPPENVVTAVTISQRGLTVPSLWWTWEQVAALQVFGRKLVQNWLAYPVTGDKPGRIDLVVNRQLWSLLDYVQRYELINRFSAPAQSYGYNVRVFDDRATFLGAYTCNYAATPLDCNLALDAGGRSGLRGGSSNPFDAAPSTGPDTVAP